MEKEKKVLTYLKKIYVQAGLIDEFRGVFEAAQGKIATQPPAELDDLIENLCSSLHLRREELKNRGLTDRHCASCQRLIKVEQVKLCSKCGVRAYCSRECQVKDWKPGNKGRGQGHKSWCGLPTGEQDLDWIVAPVKGKGRGIIAKRVIPPNTRIMVDGLLDQKAWDSESGLSFMLNHDCDSNAAKFVERDPEFKAMIVYSKREIQAGEEITYSYPGFNEIYNPHYPSGPSWDKYPKKYINSFADCRLLLEKQWGIICPEDCFCRDAALERQVIKGKLMMAGIMYGDFKKETYSRRKADADLKDVGKLLENHEKIHGDLQHKLEVLEAAFDVAVQQRRTLKRAEKFAKEAFEICSTIIHPRGKLAKNCEERAKNPSSSKLYLRMEK